MTTFVFIALLFGAYFVAGCVLAVVVMACIFWARERRERALEATRAWHCPDTLPHDWDLTREKL